MRKKIPTRGKPAQDGEQIDTSSVAKNDQEADKNT